MADVLLVEDLTQMEPSDVFVHGRHVAKEGKLTEILPQPSYPSWVIDTVKIIRGKQAVDFNLLFTHEQARVWVIDISPDQIINRAREAVLPVVNGVVVPDIEKDILKLAVVERYNKNGNIGMTFVHGFGLQRGALASSVSHDHHNIVIVGTNNEDMALCVSALEKSHGGLAVAAGGKVLDVLPLPIAGLMSTMPAKEVIKDLKKITSIAKDLGCKLPSPFMTLSFISLPSVPELGLTDLGLVDVKQHRIINTIIE
jgi:adenine deaminase